ncbi:MAG TPA: chloride channel protein [Verrucomicrobiae bacterium]|jgi:chloride channel protein, CIC family|nr:chloride channel protein [Verrucomicrobiae bacterium]
MTENIPVGTSSPAAPIQKSPIDLERSSLDKSPTGSDSVPAQMLSRFRAPRRLFEAFEDVFDEERYFLILSVFIGIFSGLAVVCFRLAIDWIHLALLGPLPQPHSLRIIFVPAIAGLVIAVLVLHLFPAIRGSGVNQTKAALYIFNGYIPFRTAVGKFLCCALAIGSGYSLGPEDPSLQIGASLASALGRQLQLSREKLRLMAPVGAAAGLAAAFNAPISAVLFVIEEVIGRWSAGILGSVVLSAVASVVVERWFLGSEPLFRIPVTTFKRPAELLAYAVLGIAGGVAAVLFAKGIGFLRPILKSRPRWTQYLQPGIAGLLIGLIGYFGFPQVMGAGYDFMDQAMHGQYLWQTLGLLALLKIVATTVSFVSGTPGGMFAPALFVGAMLGGAVGGVEHILFPHLTGSVGTYALVGTGVLFAGFLRAPMTSVFMVLETSGNYEIIVPVIVANTFAYLVSRSLQPTPIFDLLTRQDGLELPSLEEEREEAILRVEDAMLPPPAIILSAADYVDSAARRIEDSLQAVFPVRLQPSGWGAIQRDMVLRLFKEGKGEHTLGSLISAQPLPSLFPDLPLDNALRFVQSYPIIPVVNRANPQKLEGIISSQSVFAKYRVEPH